MVGRVDIPFRLLNVFAQPGVSFSGNPLAVVERAGGLTTRQMQALARQFNLSETTFVLPPDEDASRGADARVRIFTPDIEMPFAGHPTLGTASVVSSLNRGKDQVVLAMAAGLVPVRKVKDRWVLTTAHPSTIREYAGSVAGVASAVGVSMSDVVAGPVWVDSGVEQLLVQVGTVAAVRGASARADLLLEHAMAPYGEGQVLLWCREADDPTRIVARFFYTGGGSAFEDPATGSASANLGGLLGASGALDRVVVSQGDQTGRPSTLHIWPQATGHVQVGGYVVEVGRGSLHLDQVG